MWFWFSIIALICWSGSDLFSKIGCADAKDKYSHFKMVTAVGVVMGVHAFYEIFVSGVEFDMTAMLRYLPVSLLYIGSMTLGYIGLRYIELSISSPICNSSGALVALLCIITGDILAVPQYIAIALVCVGVVGLGFVEMNEDEDLRKKRQDKSNYKYSKSALAIILPLLYCLLDALGTFADSLVLETLDEDVANVAYELTFFVLGLLAFFYVVVVKKEKLKKQTEGPKFIAAIFETAGQFAYIFAIGANAIGAAPVISAYCMMSVVWSRIFLKEKLSWKHYLMIGVCVVGIVILGALEG